jgi:hypothetical protein
MSIRHTRSVRLAAAVSSALAMPLFATTATVAGLAVSMTAQAQETTTQMSGVVLGEAGQPVAGATVTVTHVPSGTSRTVTSNAEGRYSVTGLRPGGPYTVTVSGDGVKAEKFENVATTLGVPTIVDFGAAGAETLAEITVSGTRVADVGVAAKFDADQIANAPTISRDLKDIVRFEPSVNLDQGNFNAISIAGQNTRFNSLTVDGVKQNDDFGLNNSGYATNRSPVSLDAVEQVSVLTAPWDVQYSGFQGGVINVVTKSGTNDWSGSAFYYYGDDSLAGDKSRDRDIALTYEEKTYGATFGGPILQDKLFFFVSYEKFERTAPVEVGPSGSSFPSQVPEITQANYDAVRSVSQSVYGFDPQTFPSSIPEESEKILANVDWNINDSHRVRLSFQRTEDFDTTGFTTSTTGGDLASPSNWYERSYKLDQYVVQAFSNWTDALSTEFKLAKKKVDNGQEPLGGLGIGLARVDVNGPGTSATTRGGTVFVGPDVSRHANELSNDQDQAKFRAQYLLGNHTLSGGIEYEKLDVFNVFVQRARGEYYFDTLADFQNRRASRISYQNAVTNDADDAAAIFAYSNTALYLQDRFQMADSLVLTYGVRHERFDSSDTPRYNQGFAGRYGFANTETLDGRTLTLPRFGFEWTVSDRTIVNGGIGLYGGGTPNVWVSNNYSNEGVITASVDCRRSQTTPNAACPADVLASLNNVALTDLPQAYRDQLARQAGTGSVNAIDPGFKIPSSWRYQLGVEHDFDFGALGDRYRFAADATYSDVKNAVLWKDLRLVQIGTLQDGRPRYGYRPTDPSSAAGRGISTNDLLLTNTSKGSALVLSAELSKAWDTRVGLFDVSIGYAFMDSEDVTSATSSTALSNWDNVALADTNNPGLATSNYEIRHRFPMRLSWRKELFGDNESAVNLFVERRAGRPFSYTFAQASTSDATPDFNTFGDPRQQSRQRQLFYVPTGPGDVLLGGGLTWDTLNDYIVANGLDKYRGQITPRNGFRSPWVTTADLQIRQELPSFREGHKIVLQLDILNVANLINKDWGRFEQVGFPYVVPVLAASLDPATGKYVYSGTPRAKSYSINPVENSVWRMQLGIRYQF